MNNSEGSIYYGIGLDNSKLKADALKSNSIIKGIGDKTVATGARIDNTFRSVSKSIAALGGAMAFSTLAKQVFDFAEVFNKKMSAVSTISKEITENMIEYKKAVLDLTTKIPVAAEGAAEALYQIVSAGHDGAEGMKLLELSAKAAIGGVSTTLISADAITTLMNAYKKNIDDAESISDKLFTTVRLGKTTMPELGANIAQVAPTAAAYGVEMEQVLAMVATLTKSGVPTAQAMTQIRSGILATSEALGDGAFKTRTLQEAFAEVIEMAGGSESKLKELIPRVEGLNAILGSTGINAKTAASDLRSMADSAGETEQAYQKMLKESGAQITLLKNNIAKEFNSIGNSVDEASAEIAKSLNEAFDSGKVETFMNVLGALIIMYGTYKAVLIATAAVQKISLVAEMTAQYIKMANALGLATANQIMFNKAVLTNPYVLAAAGLASIVGLLYAYSKRATEAEKAQDRLNGKIDEFNNKQEEHRSKVEGLIKTIQDENETTTAKLKAYDALRQASPELTKAYKLEEIAILKTAEAQKILNEERDKAEYDNYINELEKQKRKAEDLKESIIDLESDPRMSFALSKKESSLSETQAYIVELEKKIEAVDKIRSKAKEEDAKVNEAPVVAVAESYVAGIKKEADKLQREEKNLQLSVEAARVEAMKEGLPKTLAQNELNYKQELAQLKWQQEDMIENIRKAELDAWKEKNPNYKENKLSFYSDTELSEETLNKFSALAKSASEKLKDSNKEALDEMLEDVKTYNQKYNDVVEEYENKRAQMFDGGSLREGLSFENLSELNRSKKLALQSVDEEFAQREDSYESWLASIANMTLDKLRTTLIEAEAALLTANITGEDLAETRTKIVKVKEAIKNVKVPTVEVSEKDKTSWTDLNKVLTDSKQAFDEIGESVGGAFGEIIKTAGQLAASTITMISGISKLASATVKGTEAAAEGAAVAISTAEKASIILTVISAALQVVTAIFKAFSKTDYIDIYNKKLEDLNQQLKELKVNSILNRDEQDTIFGTDKWGKMTDSINAASLALLNYNEELDNIAKRNKTSASERISEVFGLDTTPFDDYLDSIKEMQVQISHSTWFRAAKSKSLSEVVPNLIQNGKVNQEVLKTFIDSDLFKSLSEENQKLLTNMSNDWKLYEESINSVKDSLTDVFGSLGESITDILVDAWQNPTEAALNYGDTVSSMLESLAKQMVYSALLQPYVKKASEDFEKITLSDKSDEQKFKDYSATLSDLIKGVSSQQNPAERLLQQAKDIAKEEGIDIFQADSATRTAASKGIATASQESVDENNGRLTYIQGQVSLISEEMVDLGKTSGKILTTLYGIQENTSFCRKLEGIESTLDDISNRGLILRK